MLKKLELLEPHIRLIKKVCDLEHSSLIRLHNKSEEELDARADELNLEYVSLKEFHHELSNAFYEFQLLFENPENLLEMDKHYFNIFVGVAEIYHAQLHREFPDVFPEFMERVISINRLYLQRGDSSFLN